MSLEPGTRLGPYEIRSALGAGGMGEVYRARDTSLDRDVAIKVLPVEFASDPERLARFEREAKVLASLNHPNIAHIHGLERSGDTPALILELVEGPTLQDRVAQGAIPLDEALPIAKQIAEALEAAHEHGIIHRDLKPANIKVREDGTVKVLDFGLAKAIEEGARGTSEARGEDLAESPTMSMTAAATRAGFILGTAAYMSPEQARGKPVDKRTDIWAFGCVLYEMLTGRQAFGGTDIAETLAFVLTREIDWLPLPGATPAAVERVLRRCLERDPRRRWREIGDARLDLDEANGHQAAEPGAAPAGPAERFWPRVVALALAALVGAVFSGAAVWRLGSSPPASLSLTRWPVDVPAAASFDTRHLNVAIAPDGSRLVYVVREDSTSTMYLRHRGRLDATAIQGTDGAANAFFSPDGTSIAFFAGGTLKRVDMDGGSPTVLADLPGITGLGGSWGGDGTIIYNPQLTLGLSRISDTGGPPTVVTTPDRDAGELGHWWPQILPGGAAVLYTVYSSPFEKTSIAVRSLETGDTHTLVENAAFARYVNSGHLIFVRSETLMAVAFDLRRLQVTGPVVPVLDDVPLTILAAVSQFTVSDTGSLAYIPRSTFDPDVRLAWVDRNGERESVSEQAGRFSAPTISPDGTRIAVRSWNADGVHIWVYEDGGHGALTRQTFGSGVEEHPVWAPDGEHLIYASESEQVLTLATSAADGRGEAEVILSGEYDHFPYSVSPDGRTLAFDEQHPENGGDIWTIRLDGEGGREAFRVNPFDEWTPAFSPDGRWLAYESNSSGRPEVWVEAFPGPGARHQISIAGGHEPLWTQGGRELVYREGDAVMAVAVDPATGEATARPRRLFDGLEHPEGDRPFDVTPDGQHFLVITKLPDASPARPIVIDRWVEELRRLVPAN